jgi:predicted dehydrogenase
LYAGFGRCQRGRGTCRYSVYLLPLFKEPIVSEEKSVKPFRLGLIGAGGISHMHAKHIKKNPGVEIVAAADPSEAALTKFKEAFPEVKTFADYKQMLKEQKDLDAISVCTPNGLHSENTIAALEAGKHVIVEKPMAMNAKEAQKMIDAARKSGKHLVVGFQFRFVP